LASCAKYFLSNYFFATIRPIRWQGDPVEQSSIRSRSSRARSTPMRFRSGPPATCSRPGIASGSRSPARTSRTTTAIRTPARSGLDTQLAIADQVIYHDPEHPSKIVLPIMPQPIAE